MKRNPETPFRLFDQIPQNDVEDDIRRTVQLHFGSPERQAGDIVALVVLTLFFGTVALMLQLFVAN